MSDVNVQLVREFFELTGFRTMTFWQHDRLRARTADHGLQLFVENINAAPARELDFVLHIGDTAVIERALVEVRPWHADRLYASLVEENSVLFEVAGEDSLSRARQVFGDNSFSTILVISELPTSPEARHRALTVFEKSNVNYLLEFPTVLHEIIQKINPNVSYSPSYTLQTIRLLKRYGFIRRQQLEFAFHNEPLITSAPPRMDLVEPEGDYPSPEEMDLI
jgi:hypothetical protein